MIDPTDNSAPNSGAPRSTRLFGYAIVIILLLMIILLATGVVDFERPGFF
jgi:hypothetical protein